MRCTSATASLSAARTRVDFGSSVLDKAADELDESSRATICSEGMPNMGASTASAAPHTLLCENIGNNNVKHVE